MKHSFYDTGDYPIYVNPTFSEVAELGSVRWDTIRISVDDNDIGMASGHGNTHDSVWRAMRFLLKRHLLPYDYILYRVGEEYYFNNDCYTGESSVPVERCLREDFSDEHAELIRELIRNT